MFAHQVSSADVCHMARRIDWVSGTVYDPYDDDISPTNPSFSEATNLADSNFYVITDEFKVYKCLDNNENADSTIKPTATSTSAVTLADGYTWKFLFQVSSADQSKFLDTNYIPVRKLSGNPTFDVNGEIDSISVLTGGSGYTTATVSIQGDGTGASATAVIVGDAIDSITVDTAGSGYTFAFITITGDGTLATADVSLGDADTLPPLQTAVEAAATAIGGAIDRFVVTDPGQDYIDGDTIVTITGDGTGAEASVDIAPTTGAILGLTVTAGGTGYSFADITFTQGVGVGTQGAARAIISPAEGHGANPVKELFASTIACVVSLQGDTNTDLTLDNDFRQIGLIKNVDNFAGTEFYTGSTATAAYVIDVNSDADYATDDIIDSDDGGQFRVSQIRDDNSGTFQIHLVPIIPLITVSSTLTNTTQAITSLSINSLTEPEINSQTGDVFYIENRLSILRQDDQVETIKALINF